ncbi:hypothetical protein LTR56_020281 [Elasticomyces elasticus]|nr:hypothetical protein LTR56_020281 [Elasticomyces elasticus]KAK3644549.1 hypothetical protein LTR22_015147 [Elasticomyces elasticus]KAK4910401.1 hypothetical protein LTR49_020917 [Elasticomyces elasticus]KAK5750066.1 hypothetical protein LTS12_019871 [Elasticomyces elasticus]
MAPKRKTTATAPTQPIAKKSRGPPSDPPEAPVEQRGDGSVTGAKTFTLEPINIASTSTTTNLNRWLEAIKDNKMRLTGQQPAFTPQALPTAAQAGAAIEPRTRQMAILASKMPAYFADDAAAPAYNQRKFELVEIKRIFVSRKLAAADISTSIEVWAIVIRDVNQAKSPLLTLYGETPGLSTSTIRLGGPLEVANLPDEADVRKLAGVVCTIVTSYPAALYEASWNTHSSIGWGRPRRQIEIMALELCWTGGFIYHRVSPRYWDFPENAFFRLASEAYLVGGTLTLALPIHYEGLETGFASRRILEHNSIEIDVSKLDFAKLSKLAETDPVPDVFIHGTKKLVVKSGTLPDEQKTLLLQLLNHVEYSTFGCTGGLVQVQRFAVSFIQPYTTQVFKFQKGEQRVDTVLHGVLGGKPFWRRPLRRPTGDGPTITIAPSFAAVDTVTGELIDLRVRAGDIGVAYVLNRMLLVLSAGGHTANAWQAGVVAADTVNAAGVSEDEMLAEQCSCTNMTERESAVHVCATGCGLYMCSNMVFNAKGGLVCGTHALQENTTWEHLALQQDRLESPSSNPKQGQAESSKPGQRLDRPSSDRKQRQADFPKTGQRFGSGWRLQYPPTESGMVVHMFSNTLDRAGPTTLQERQAVRDSLVKMLDSTPEGSYPDAYDGTRKIPRADLEERARDTASGGRRRPHPFQPSPDAIMPFTLKNGVAEYHALENLVITAFFLNIAKSIWVPMIIAVLRLAAIETSKERDGQRRQSVWWDMINIALDHIHMLAVLLPHPLATRLQQALLLSDEQYQQLLKAWQSGQYDSSLPDLRKYGPSTGGDIITDKMLDDMVNGKYQPKSLSHPLTEEATAVCTEAFKVCGVWTPAQQKQLADLVTQIENDSRINPQNLKMPRGPGGAPWPFRKDHMPTDGYLWEWWHRELVARLIRWMLECDWAHETKESPATLLGLVVVVYFRTGGFDDYLHLEMTIWRLHPARFSFGRASWVLAGSIMRSGFIVLFPTNFAEHFRVDLQTAVCQPWIVNLLWLDFPATLRNLILPALVELPPQTPYYGPVRPDLPAIEYPKSTVAGRRAERKANGALDTEEQIADSEDEDAIVSGSAAKPTSGGQNGAQSSQASLTPEEKAALRAQEEAAQREALPTRLQTFRDELQHWFRDAEVDGDLLAFADRMTIAVTDGNVEVYSEAEAEARALFESLKASSGGIPFWQRNSCRLCSEHDDARYMITCSGKCGRMLHFWCAGLQAMSKEHEKPICGDCKLSPPPSSLPKNLPHIINSCYLAVAVQALRSIDEVRETVSIFPVGQIGKHISFSGRDTEAFDSPGKYGVIAKHIEGPERLAEIARRSTEHMKDARALANELRVVFRGLDPEDNVGVTTQDFKRFFDAGRRYNTEEFNHDMNDASAVFSELLNCLILVTDNSDISGRHGRETLNAMSAIAVADGEPLEQLKTDCERRLTVYRAEGRATHLSDLFAIQTIKESVCPDKACLRIARGDEYEMELRLAFPEVQYNVVNKVKHRTTPMQFTLTEILENWQTETISPPERLEPGEVVGVACRYESEKFGLDHRPRATIKIKRITRLPPVLMLTLSRQYDEFHRSEDVAIPEFLDMAPYAEDVVLPSEDLTLHIDDPTTLDQLPASRRRRRRALFSDESIYRLSAVGMHIGGNHYAAYLVHDGQQWIVADDLGVVKPRHPQAAINDKHRPSFLIYKQQKGWTQLPLDAQGQPTQGFVLNQRAKDLGPSVTPYAQPPPRQFACPYTKTAACTEVFDTRAKAEQHASDAHTTTTPPPDDNDFDMGGTNDDHTCSTCHKTFGSTADLEGHVRADHEHTCTVVGCKEVFTTVQERTMHETDKHVTCQQCFTTFISQEAVDAHVEKEHALVTCSICQEVVDDVGALGDHERASHPFCELCLRPFASTDQLEDHARTSHSYCKPCGMAFGTSAALVDHNSTTQHFACGECEEVSTSQEALDAHRQTHISFLCATCSSRFASQALLTQHQQVSHPQSGDAQSLIEALRAAEVTAGQRLAELREQEATMQRNHEGRMREVRQQEEEARKAHAERMTGLYDVQRAAALMAAKSKHEESIRAIDAELHEVLDRIRQREKEAESSGGLT